MIFPIQDIQDRDFRQELVWDTKLRSMRWPFATTERCWSVPRQIERRASGLWTDAAWPFCDIEMRYVQRALEPGGQCLSETMAVLAYFLIKLPWTVLYTFMEVLAYIFLIYIYIYIDGSFRIFSDKTSMDVFVVTVVTVCSSLVGFHVASHRCALRSRCVCLFLGWMLCPLVI